MSWSGDRVGKKGFRGSSENLKMRTCASPKTKQPKPKIFAHPWSRGALKLHFGHSCTKTLPAFLRPNKNITSRHSGVSTPTLFVYENIPLLSPC
jgi:hypothetical protein